MEKVLHKYGIIIH